MRLSCVLLSVFLTAAVVLALPRGAPSCVVGEDNPKSEHLDPDRNPMTGEIQVGGFDVFINDVKLNFTSTPDKKTFEFGAGKGQKITIKAENGASTRFKGVLLLRSEEGTNTKGGILPRDSFTAAPGCLVAQIAGATHSERSLK